jgi:uncharacterized membrane protein
MHILYLGDNAGSSAEYLKDILSELEHTVTHVDATKKIDNFDPLYECIIISDYPAGNLSDSVTSSIIKHIENGNRLIMIGGWDSFNGRGQNYANHPLAKILPVNLQVADDRVNASQGLMLKGDPLVVEASPIDWQHPPVICGYNAFEVGATASVLVWMRPIDSNGTSINLLQDLPLVAVDSYGKGVSLACGTDLAPHWCGGLVDWGSERRSFSHVEVGDMYIEFIRFLLEAIPNGSDNKT